MGLTLRIGSKGVRSWSGSWRRQRGVPGGMRGNPYSATCAGGMMVLPGDTCLRAGDGPRDVRKMVALVRD